MTDRNALSITVLCLLLSGCASNNGNRTAASAGSQCPEGKTLTCTVRKVGRIHHGSFNKNYDHCTCVESPLGDVKMTLPQY